MSSAAILSGSDYLAQPRNAETFLIEPLLPLGGAMTIYGDPKVGKSYAGIQLAVAIVSGHEWLGFPVRQRGKVVYVQLDTPRSLWADRLDQLREGGVCVESIHFADRETLNTWPFDIMNPEHFQVLSSALAAIQPVAVIIDTLKETNQVEENSNTESQKVVAALTAATQPAALILIHHGRKPNPEHPDEIRTGARGAGYLVGKMDAIVHFGKKSIHYIGRAIEEGSVRLDRLDNGFWALQTDETDKLIEGILAGPGSQSEMARQLGQRIGRSEEASRSLIRRYRASQRPPQK